MQYQRSRADPFCLPTEDKAAGKDVRLNLEKQRRIINDLKNRLESRKKSLNAMRHVTSATPVVLTGALVVPIGLLRRLKGEPENLEPLAAIPKPAPKSRSLPCKLSCRARNPVAVTASMSRPRSADEM